MKRHKKLFTTGRRCLSSQHTIVWKKVHSCGVTVILGREEEGGRAGLWFLCCATVNAEII